MARRQTSVSHEEALPKGTQPMFLSLRDAGVSDAPPATNVRWVHTANDGTLVLNLWRKDFLPETINGRLVAAIWPRNWDFMTSIRRDKRDELIESLTEWAGRHIRVVVLEGDPRKVRKHRGTRFDCDRRWRVQIQGRAFRLIRARAGEAGDDTPPETPKEFGKLKPGRREVVSRQIERSGRVKTRTLERARYRCEIPGCSDHRHYQAMDVHHVTSLGMRGADHTRNTVALCPACHTRVHRGTAQVREKFEKAIKKILKSRRRP